MRYILTNAICCLAATWIYTALKCAKKILAKWETSERHTGRSLRIYIKGGNFRSKFQIHSATVFQQ